MKKMQQKHEAHMLMYAVGSKGQLVNIDDVRTGNECGCFCPACKEPLMAKNQGLKKIHHFAHQSGTECEFAYESMLHLLAKEKVRNAFLNNEEFLMGFEYKSYCPKSKQCVYVRYDECLTIQQKLFDLKKYYDSCEQEICYDKIRRRSDLKIYSSTHQEREPIYIEFCVTHASDEAKLHSGNKIIEILIEDEDDISNLTKNGFTEKMSFNMYSEQDPSKINFYGFNWEDYKNHAINSTMEFVRYVLDKSGETYCYQDYCKYKGARKAYLHPLFEMRFHTISNYENKIKIDNYAKYVCFQKYGIPNCRICRNHVVNYNGVPKVCNLKIPQYKSWDNSRAKGCRCFMLNKEDMEEKLKNGAPAPYDILYMCNLSKIVQ